jgi:quercetin dioxygenase-like cupin family protein
MVTTGRIDRLCCDGSGYLPALGWEPFAKEPTQRLAETLTKPNHTDHSRGGITGIMSSHQEQNTRTTSGAKTEGWFTARPGERFCVRVPAASTGGIYSVIEIVSSPGDSTPLHVHHKEDEYAIVLEGVAKIVYGSEVIHAQAGTSICLKRGIPHGWGNPTDRPIRILMIASPGGCEEALQIIARGRPVDYEALYERFEISPVGPPILS